MNCKTLEMVMLHSIRQFMYCHGKDYSGNVIIGAYNYTVTIKKGRLNQ